MPEESCNVLGCAEVVLDVVRGADGVCWVRCSVLTSSYVVCTIVCWHAVLPTACAMQCAVLQ
eukprot:589675-Rhodomonas_salina.2